MDEIMLLMYMFMGIGAFIGIFIGFIKFNTYRWITMKRRMTGKNYGIVYFKTHGKSLYPIVKDFDNDVIETRGGKWVIQKDKIYLVTGDPKMNNTEKNKDKSSPIKKTEIQINEEDIKILNGVPVIYLDLNDMIPLKFSNDPEIEGYSRVPQHIEAVLSKEIAAAEAESLYSQKNKLTLLIALVLIVAIIGVALSAIAFNNTNTIIAGLQHIDGVTQQTLNNTVMLVKGV